MTSSSDRSAATSSGDLLPLLRCPTLNADMASAASVIMSFGLDVPRNAITASFVCWLRYIHTSVLVACAPAGAH